MRIEIGRLVAVAQVQDLVAIAGLDGRLAPRTAEEGQKNEKHSRKG
jgi:hypothetical protein